MIMTINVLNIFDSNDTRVREDNVSMLSVYFIYLSIYYPGWAENKSCVLPQRSAEMAS